MSRLEQKLITLSREYVNRCPTTQKSRHVTFLVASKFILIGATNNETASHNRALGYYGRRIHSEFACLQKFRRQHTIDQIEKLDMYNLRVLRDGSIGNSMPCSTCAKMLQIYKPHRVWYTDDDGEFRLWT